VKQIPIKSIPSQAFKVVLDGQNVKIKLYQKPEGLFFDLAADGTDIVVAVLAYDAIPLISREYAGFKGQMMFIDTQGNSAPEYSELADRYSLVYFNEEESALI
jgi:hypothetical protein